MTPGRGVRGRASWRSRGVTGRRSRRCRRWSPPTGRRSSEAGGGVVVAPPRVIETPPTSQQTSALAGTKGTAATRARAARPEKIGVRTLGSPWVWRRNLCSGLPWSTRRPYPGKKNAAVNWPTFGRLFFERREKFGFLATFDDRARGRHIRGVNLLSRLSPDPASVRLDTWAIEPARPAITLTLRPRSRTARCPLCERRAGRVHSRYERTLADLPWGEHTVALRLRVRRLFCDNPRCERRIFAERLPGVAAPWARRTARLAGAADGDRPRAGRGRRRPAEPRPARAGRAQHPAAAGPGGALAARGHALGPRGRRLGAAQAPQLRHRAGRPGAAAAGGPAARPRGGDLRALAARAPRRRGCPPATVPAPTPTGSGAARPGRCRSPTASTCCRTWPRRWSWCSPRTPRACARSTGAISEAVTADGGPAPVAPSRPPARARPWPPSDGSGARPGIGRLGAPPPGLARPRRRPAARHRPRDRPPPPAERDLRRAQGAQRRGAQPDRSLGPPGDRALDRRPPRRPPPLK